MRWLGEAPKGIYFFLFSDLSKEEELFKLMVRLRESGSPKLGLITCKVMGDLASVDDGSGLIIN